MINLTEDKNQDIAKIRQLIVNAINKIQPLVPDFKLNEIQYLISYTVNAVGDFQPSSNTLRISAKIAAESDDEINNVIYHELAHYLASKVLGTDYNNTHAVDEWLLTKLAKNFDDPNLFEKYNLKTIMPGLCPTDKYLFMLDQQKPIDIISIETGDVIRKASEFSSFAEEIPYLKSIYKAFAKISPQTVLNIPDKEWTDADPEYQHGILWRFIADCMQKKLGCVIDKYYSNGNILSTGINYKVSCPTCNWTEVVNIHNRPETFKLCQAAERDPERNSLECTKCGSDLTVSNYNTGKLISESWSLLEATRTQLAANSRNAGEYKDKSHGKNRFERKKLSKIAATVKQYNNIDMNKLFKTDTLEVEIPVIGETDNYSVTIRINGVIAEVARNIKVNKYKLEFRTIIQSLTKVFNTADVFVNCTCPDHKYNFDHWNIMHGCSTTDSAHDPGPGKGTANPNDDKGRGCKHTLLVIANGDWMMKVASVINNYLHYMSEKMQKPFLKLIFPKLYGCEADEMAKLDILGKDEVEETLDSSTSFIDAINEYGKNRGKIQKGSNRNTTNKAIEEPVPEDEITQQEDPNAKNLEKAEKESDAADKQAQKDAEKLEDEANKPAEEEPENIEDEENKE